MAAMTLVQKPAHEVSVDMIEEFCRETVGLPAAWVTQIANSRNLEMLCEHLARTIIPAEAKANTANRLRAIAEKYKGLKLASFSKILETAELILPTAPPGLVIQHEVESG